jgi:hypothetical protein
MSSGRVILSGLYHLSRHIHKSKPDIVQTWMYHADLIGGVIALSSGIKNVFWNIWHKILEAGHSKCSTILIAKLCAKLGKRVPKGIECCAEKAIEVHDRIGYDTSKMTVIVNGYNLSYLRIIPSSKERLTEELGRCIPLNWDGRAF